MILDEIKEEVKKTIIDKMLKSASKGSQFQDLAITNIYRCKLCGDISLREGYHSCDITGKTGHIAGEKELAGEIDNELLIMDLANQIRKVLQDPEIIERISSAVHYR